MFLRVITKKMPIKFTGELKQAVIKLAAGQK